MATNEEVVSFINTLSNLAIAESNRRIARGEKFVVPSVCMGQSAHETGWGTSSLMTKANAFFGIKAGGSWTGKVFTADTWEVKDGVAYNTVANFRAYDSLEDSVADYYDLIVKNSRYSKALSTYPDDIKSAYDTLYEIWAGGYATDENYVPNVYNLMEGRDLMQYDSLIDGVTFDPDYTWEGGTGGSGGSGGGSLPDGEPVTGDSVAVTTEFEHVEMITYTDPIGVFEQIEKA